VSSTAGMPDWWVRLVSEDAEESEKKGAKAGGQQTILLSFMGYFWWLIVGGVMEILFGALYLGSKQSADIQLGNPWLQLLYVLVGILMIETALGILRLEFWVYWAAIALSLVLLGLSIYQIVRWSNGTHMTLETVIFTILNVLFALYNIFFVLQPGVRIALHRAAPLRKGEFSPDLVILAVVVTLPALAATLLVNYQDPHLSTPLLGLIYIGGTALMIVMAYSALKLQTWSWVMTWVWAAVLAALCLDLIVGRITGGNLSVEGLLASIASLLFTTSAVYYLLRSDVRRAFIHPHSKMPVFSPPIVMGGLLLAGFAILIYLLPSVFGTQAVAFAVVGLVVGAIVGLLPGADPIARLMGFMVGLLIAETSYLVRGGLLPYTHEWSALVVGLMLAVITGIAALFRSSAWFVSMLLGAGTLYALAELSFQAGPSAYLATSGLAFVSILFSFGIGYMISSLLGIQLVPTSQAEGGPEAPTDGGPTTQTRAGAQAKGSEGAVDITTSQSGDQPKAGKGAVPVSSKSGDQPKAGKGAAQEGVTS